MYCVVCGKPISPSEHLWLFLRLPLQRVLSGQFAHISCLKTASRPAPKKPSRVEEGIGCLFLTAILIAVVYPVYSGLDSLGWISHREETTITAEVSWFVGESKECTSYPLDAAMARATGKETGYAVASLFCDSGPVHNVRIRFFGRLRQAEYDTVVWKCTREQDAFTCYELSGHKPERYP
jgi:hypothetical protein